MSRRVHVTHLDISVRGLDERTVTAALALLGDALAAEVGGPGAPDDDGPVRFDRAPSAAALASRLARHVAGDIRAPREEAT
jgi:hypothetical protein